VAVAVAALAQAEQVVLHQEMVELELLMILAVAA
jgi:hypothetical protein